MKQKEVHSGIYLLPNLLTTASLFAAFYSIVASLKSFYEPAAVAIFIGIIADSLDGRIARMTNTQSAFGAEYDSLSDMVTFGVAPALLVYSWQLQHWGKLGWLLAFFYTAAVALRLARFNTQLDVADKRYFQGLPSPAAAAISASFVWLSSINNWQHSSVSFISMFITIAVAILMVSNVRYYSFKDLDMKGRVPFLYVLIVLLLFVLIAASPAIVLFSGFTIYGLSGLLSLLRRDANDVETVKNEQTSAADDTLES